MFQITLSENFIFSIQYLSPPARHLYFYYCTLIEQLTLGISYLRMIMPLTSRKIDSCCSAFRIMAHTLSAKNLTDRCILDKLCYQKHKNSYSTTLLSALTETIGTGSASMGSLPKASWAIRVSVLSQSKTVKKKKSGHHQKASGLFIRIQLCSKQKCYISYSLRENTGLVALSS